MISRLAYCRIESNPDQHFNNLFSFMPQIFNNAIKDHHINIIKIKTTLMKSLFLIFESNWIHFSNKIK